MRITPTQQAALTEAIIEESGGDTARISRSYATVDRSRRKVVGDVAHTIREGWSPPGLTTLHWDSKLMPSLTDNHRREERLTVVVGDNVDLKLLGTPSYQPGSNVSAGELIASHTMELLHEWHCADTIVSMCFDTTASNTGPVTAACVTIQLKLGRALLWSACRHHRRADRSARLPRSQDRSVEVARGVCVPEAATELGVPAPGGRSEGAAVSLRRLSV